ncbi:hypothetical protein FKW77_007020 [Venturia effusa]|uniref:Uncharacterized protein n=1 Tax=Venturia effusa TaxID=50376 RepID=A0A517LJ68_9PEZI|nr:hypothetical protein FKW77_007020 [Venturia effusa]
MGLQSCSLSDLVEIDKTYLTRIKDRRSLIETRCGDVVGCNPVAKDAVYELYTWIFTIYLPRRFPTMFALVVTEKGGSGGYLLNRVTDERIDTTPAPDPVDSLKTLGRHIDNEFLILLPTSSPTAPASPKRIQPIQPTQSQSPQSEEESYHLHAFTLCYPSGFNTVQKLGLPLSAIHAPVPGYSIKIQKSMDRFFASLPFGKIVKRANWSVQLDDAYFHRDSNHIDLSRASDDGGEVMMAPATYSPTSEEVEGWEMEAESVRVEECRLRCERQTLHRLEKTGALVFGFKTYLYELGDVKREGNGEEMARAVEGLWKGNARRRSPSRIFSKSQNAGQLVRMHSQSCSVSPASNALDDMSLRVVNNITLTSPFSPSPYVVRSCPGPNRSHLFCTLIRALDFIDRGIPISAWCVSPTPQQKEAVKLIAGFQLGDIVLLVDQRIKSEYAPA